MSRDGDPDADALLSAGEAARMLGVRVEILRGWEQQFGFPVARTSPGGEVAYSRQEIAELRDQINREFSVANAIAKVRDRKSPGP